MKSLPISVFFAICATCYSLRLQSNQNSEGKAVPGPLDRFAELLDDFEDSRILMERMPYSKEKNMWPSPKPFRDVAEKMVFLVHHKMGTILADSLVHKRLAPALNSEVDERWEGWWAKYGFNNTPTLQHQVCFYYDAKPWFLKEMLDLYPNLRVVHIIRDPISELVSAVQYHRRQKRFGDTIPAADAHLFWPVSNNITAQLNIELYAELRHKPDGEYLPPLLRLKDVFKQLDGNSNVLTVRYEDFVSNYDDTTRRIFTHVLGVDHPLIEGLVESSQADDVGRWNATQITHNNHVSDKSEKKALFDGIQNMIDQQEDMAMEMMRIREELGY